MFESTYIPNNSICVPFPPHPHQHFSWIIFSLLCSLLNPFPIRIKTKYFSLFCAEKLSSLDFSKPTSKLLCHSEDLTISFWIKLLSYRLPLGGERSRMWVRFGFCWLYTHPLHSIPSGYSHYFSTISSTDRVFPKLFPKLTLSQSKEVHLQIVLSEPCVIYWPHIFIIESLSTSLKIPPPSLLCAHIQTHTHTELLKDSKARVTLLMNLLHHMSSFLPIVSWISRPSHSLSKSVSLDIFQFVRL